MADLGDLGATTAEEERPEQDSFGWYGHRVRLSTESIELMFVDWGEQIGDLNARHPKALASIKGLFRDFIDAEDFDTFWGEARRQGLGVEDLMGLVSSIVEAQSGRPTRSPADSSPGRAGTRGTSASTTGSGRPGKSKGKAKGKAHAASESQVAKLEAAGRPDLALVHVLAEEARSA